LRLHPAYWGLDVYVPVLEIPVYRGQILYDEALDPTYKWVNAFVSIQPLMTLISTRTAVEEKILSRHIHGPEFMQQSSTRKQIMLGEAFQ
jgi:hypothetical protein